MAKKLLAKMLLDVWDRGPVGENRNLEVNRMWIDVNSEINYRRVVGIPSPFDIVGSATASHGPL